MGRAIFRGGLKSGIGVGFRFTLLMSKFSWADWSQLVDRLSGAIDLEVSARQFGWLRCVGQRGSASEMLRSPLVEQASSCAQAAITKLIGAILLEQNDEWTAQHAR
jgi:hypothetical protein